MADNVTANAGSGGASFAADDISSVYYPRIKLIYGADGVNSGDVALANGLPVQPATGSTFAISAASLPLPSGAATAAKQPALGTAGSASSDVITVQGVASMTALKVDGSAVTQPISGTLSAVTSLTQFNGNAISTGNGVAGAGVLRVTLASDGTGVVAATQSGTWNVGTVSTLTTLSQFGGNAINLGNGTVGTGTLRVTLASDGTGVVAATQSGTWNVGTVSTVTTVSQFGGNAINLGNGTVGTGTLRVTLASDSTGQVALAAGSATVGNVGLVTRTSGGLSISRVISAATTNATSAKGSAGQVYSIMASNTNASARYLKLYNKASAPTVGSDTPVMTILIPPNSSGVVGQWPHGIAFGTGIAYAITTGVADADTGAVSANENVVHVMYA